MAGSQQGVPDLRIGVPTLEPDPAFITQLAGLAAAAAVPVVVRRPHHLKVALAAASVATIATGGAWASGALTGNGTPTPPAGPVDHPGAPFTTPSATTDDGVAPDDPSPQGSRAEDHRRTAQPGDDDAGPAGGPLPTETEDEHGEQREPAAEDGPDSSGISGDGETDDEGLGDADLSPDDQTTGDDGSKGPDPSDADD